MNDQLSMFVQTTFEETTSTIFSPESADGAMPSDSQDGTTSEPSGQEAALVSRFRARDSSEAMPTADTSGPLFTHSSPSANLQQSLENRLRRNLEGSGSPLFALTWKQWDMPAGPPICALRASVRRTSGNDCGGWPTPTVSSCDQHKDNPSPRQTGGTTLGGAAKTVGWATPTVPRQNDTDHSAFRWNPNKKQIDPLLQLIGRKQSLSDVPMEKRGQLNPAFSLWLMGYPTAWARCAARVTRLCRKSQQNL